MDIVFPANIVALACLETLVSSCAICDQLTHVYTVFARHGNTTTIAKLKRV